ncbi:response regulator [Massilia yuzhufengensis]|uniref:Response regulator receiver domain-containing protein n=1 Tax=Massilia yuzhufengensis TaxID=1164594 RepID=A0A1I1UTR6_9BURK|nr:response regulator [Massilia yuzhufengensis]SFD74156.1 Response regulator receiver domain-containing protein [Massilia yuzhufengensis]
MTLPSSPAPFAAPQRVLLLDDDRFMLDVLRDMLDGLGPFVVHAEIDARRALDALPRHAPDLLICDLAMPDMDGIEFLQAAAGQGFSGRVILVSALEDGVRNAATELARALGLQVAGAFRKPVGIEQLRRAVQC